LNKLLIVSTLRNVSVKVLRRALTGKLNLISGYMLNPLDVNHWPSLGLGADPAAPRLLSGREFRKQGGLLWTSRLTGRAFFLPLFRLPDPFLRDNKTF